MLIDFLKKEVKKAASAYNPLSGATDFIKNGDKELKEVTNIYKSLTNKKPEKEDKQPNRLERTARKTRQ